MAHKASSQLPGDARSNIAVPVPDGAAAGDIGAVGLFVQSTNPVTPPPGFDPTPIYDSGLSAQVRLVVLWKRLTGADSGTWTFTTPTSQWTRAVAGLWSGRLATGNPFTASNGAHSGSGVTSLAIPAFTAATGDDVLGVATSFNNDSWTPPDGLVERQDVGQGITLVSGDGVAAGSTGPFTFTASGSSGIAGWAGALAVEPLPVEPVSDVGRILAARLSIPAASGELDIAHASARLTIAEATGVLG